MTPPKQESAVEVPIDELASGMILAEPARDPDSNDVLLPDGTELTTDNIESLKNRDVYRVYVTESSHEKHGTDSDEVGDIDFTEEELEQLAEDVLEDHEREQQEKEEERREFYQETINFTRVLFEDIAAERGINMNELEERVEAITRMLSEQQEETLKMTRIRNDANYLLSHTVNMTILSLHLGRELDFSRRELIELGIGCMLHDIGMAAIPDRLLEKEESLTDKEYRVIQSHPLYKEELLEGTNSLSYFARSVVFQHHERIDGSGYPEGLKNGEISKLARVAAVADSYEAMVSPRVYRDRKTSYEAMQIIIQDAGHKYWEEAARAFYRSMAIYPIGSVVELNSGEIGVVHQTTAAPMRPKIKVLVDENGDNPEPAPIVNMVEDQDYFINDVLNEVDA